MMYYYLNHELSINKIHIWRLPSLSEFTPMIFDKELTHLGTKASNCNSSPHTRVQVYKSFLLLSMKLVNILQLHKQKKLYYFVQG